MESTNRNHSTTNGTPTSIMGPACDTKLQYPLRKIRFAGRAGPTLVGHFWTKKYFCRNFEGVIGASNERVFSDAGYSCSKCILQCDLLGQVNCYELQKASRASHETLNQHLKSFHLLKHVYRHHVNTHRNVFFAILNIT